jgi:hypothetical protein
MGGSCTREFTKISRQSEFGKRDEDLIRAISPRQSEIMKIIFTLCSNNYYAQALTLGKSLLRHSPQYKFVIGLIDKRTDQIVYDPRFELLPVAEIEPEIYELAMRYSIVELNTCVKPAYFNYFYKDRNVTEVYYLDPDLFIYNDISLLSQMLGSSDIILTPHILSPIPFDGKFPMENDFTNFGLYNLGFLATKRSETCFEILNWWKERTYKMGYRNLPKGIFVDQSWMSLAPVIFKNVLVLDHPGFNMGPWNLHERKLSHTENDIMVNTEYKLFIYHFSSFNPSKNFELHPVYNRFTMAQRTDLQQIYEQYSHQLKENHFIRYSSLPCHYIEWKNERVEQARLEILRSIPFGQRMMRNIKKNIPPRIKLRLLKALET